MLPVFAAKEAGKLDVRWWIASREHRRESNRTLDT
jgi:hypothetical protein